MAVGRLGRDSLLNGFKQTGEEISEQDKRIALLRVITLL